MVPIGIAWELTQLPAVVLVLILYADFELAQSGTKECYSQTRW